MKKVIASALAFAAIPTLALAQLTIDPGQQNATGIVIWIQNIIKTATQLLIAAAVVYFLFGVFQFVKSGGDEEARKAGRDKIVSGVIGIAVMVSVWGLVAWVTNTTGTANKQAIPAPELPQII